VKQEAQASSHTSDVVSETQPSCLPKILQEAHAAHNFYSSDGFTRHSLQT